MAKSKALAKAEGKLKKLVKSLKDAEKRVKVLVAKEAKAGLAALKKAAAKKKSATKKKATGKKKVASKKKVVSKKKAGSAKKVTTKRRKTKKVVAVAEAMPTIHEQN